MREHDPYTDARAAFMSKSTGKDTTINRGVRMSPMKKFMEARLGKANAGANLGRFLANDRKVRLRFYCC